jgi:hypothetical protein
LNKIEKMAHVLFMFRLFYQGLAFNVPKISLHA